MFIQNFRGSRLPSFQFLIFVAGKSFDITYIRIVFYSPRPESFAIYKRQTTNGSWVPYQFYRCVLRRFTFDTHGEWEYHLISIRLYKETHFNNLDEQKVIIICEHNDFDSWMKTRKILSHRRLLLCCVRLSLLVFYVLYKNMLATRNYTRTMYNVHFRGVN